MKAFYAAAALSLLVTGSVSAQPWGGPDYGYRGGGGGYEYEERRPSYRGGGYAFDEREYLRCNPDVRRAVNRGQMESGIVHYQTFGRREGRRLSC